VSRPHAVELILLLPLRYTLPLPRPLPLYRHPHAVELLLLLPMRYTLPAVIQVVHPMPLSRPLGSGAPAQSVWAGRLSRLPLYGSPRLSYTAISRHQMTVGPAGPRERSFRS
jgi:hypothetical protein